MGEKMLLKWSNFQNVKNPFPTPREGTFDDFIKDLNAHRGYQPCGEKKDGPGISGAVFRSKRKKSNVTSLYLIGLDLDALTPKEWEVWQRGEALDCAHCVHTTYSDVSTSTVRKARAWIPLSRPLTGDEGERLIRSMITQWGADEACKDASRLFFTVWRADTEFYVHPGEYMNPQPLLDREAAQKQRGFPVNGGFQPSTNREAANREAAYVRGVLDSAVRNIRGAVKGTRHNTCLSESPPVGSYAWSEHLDEAQALKALSDAAASLASDKGEENDFVRAVNDGFYLGTVNNREIPSPKISPKKKRRNPPPQKKATSPPVAYEGGEGREEVELRGDLEDRSRTTIQWLDAHNQFAPSIFVRGRELVRLVKDRDHLEIQSLNARLLRAFLGERVQFSELVRIKDKSGGFTEFKKTVNLKISTSENILSRSGWPFPPLEEVIRHPVLAPTGQIITASGYYQPIQAWVDLGDLRVNVPSTPTQGEIDAAKQLIMDELLCDFPFIDSSSMAHALALGLGPFMRPAIDGCTPPHLVTATMERTGKGLLIDALATVAIGAEPLVITEGRDDDEWRKRITSTLMRSPSIIKIDNINRKLDSASLASCFTTRWWCDRILGKSENCRLRNNATWAITANNPQASGEIIKRCVWIGLDPKCEKPEERTDFRHPRILAWVRDNREHLVSAFLTLIQAWVAQGMPRASRTLGSFESWAEAMGGLFETVGIPGFLGNRDSLLQRAGSEDTEWHSLIDLLWTSQQERFKAGQPEAHKPSELRDLALKRDLLLDRLGDKSEKSQTIRMGKALRAKQDRIYSVLQDGERVIVALRGEIDKKGGRFSWRLVRSNGERGERG